MVKIVKSAVKCYKKKTKKTVGGKRKIYEYNQYLVPLKRSDKFACDEDVFIIPKKQLEDLAGGDISAVENIFTSFDSKNVNIEAYERELAELEWKHNELSKSYKELVSKNTKTNKKLRLDDEKIKAIENENFNLKKDLNELKMLYKTLKQNFEIESQKNKANDEENNVQKDKDIWTSLKSRLGSKKDGEGD
jgi:chromosome segregation ATPase